MRRAVAKTSYRGIVAVSVAVGAALPTCVVARTQAGADVTLTTAIASNPFQTVVGSSESASASVGLSPWITFTEADTKLRLSGDVRITEYAKTFPTSDSFRVSADGSWQIDPRLSLDSRIAYSESTVGETNLIENLNQGVIIIQDPALIGIRSRNQSLNTSVSAQYRPDPKQKWSVSLYAIDSRFTNLTAGNNYAVYGETISYDRVMRRGTFGASLNLQRYECRSVQICSQVVATPQLTASMRLSGPWTLSAAAGFSYSKLRQPGFDSNTVTPSVDATLCRKDARSDVCLSGSYTVQATALNGVTPLLSANLTSSYRLTERNRISLNGYYASGSQGNLTADTFRYVGVRLSDDHRVRRNLYLVVTGSHSITDSSFLGRRSNSEVSIGLRFSFGRAA